MEFIKLNELPIEDIKHLAYDVAVSTESELLEFNILNKIPNLNEKKKLSMIASRPGMGKSTFMLQVAAACTLFENEHCHIFSTKDAKEEVAYRILNFVQNNEIANSLPIEICACKKLNIEDLEKEITTHITEGIVFIDSMELVISPSYRRTLAKLKSMAIKKNLHIVLTANLPRIVGNQKERLKALSKIKHFNAADYIMVLHREPFDFNHPEKSNEVELTVTDGNYSQVDIKTLYWNRYFFDT